MVNYSYDELLDMLIKEIPIKNAKKCYCITFFALPAMGKSTVAKKIAEKTGLYITANDQVRRMLDDLGYTAEVSDSDFPRKLATDRTEYMLSKRTSMILDANVQNSYQQTIERFNKYNAKIYFVELNCSEEEVLRRLDKRALSFGKDKENLSRADRKIYYREVEKAKNNTVPREIIFHTIDTEKELDSQIDELLVKINEDLEDK